MKNVSFYGSACAKAEKDFIVGDSVQWFRAEAEFERALERMEQKHAEFERIIRRFAYDRDSWNRLADEFSTSPGHIAYAKEQADKCETMRADAAMKYEHGGIPFLMKRLDKASLCNCVLIWRSEENKMFNFDRYVKLCCIWTRSAYPFIER